MILRLYGKTETAFASNGIGILKDVRDDEVLEALPGRSELSFRYPATGIHANDLVEDNYVTARPNPLKDPQPFRICRVSRATPGWITVQARHLVYRLQGIVTRPFTATSWDGILGAMADGAVIPCPFSFEAEMDPILSFTLEKPAAIWTLLGSGKGMLQEKFGGEYEFDGWTVRIRKQLGRDRGVAIRYGKNLLSLEAEQVAGNRFNGICPYFTNEAGNQQLLPEGIVMCPWYAEGEEKRIQPVDLTQMVEILGGGEAALRMAAEDHVWYMTDDSETSIRVDFVQLSRTEEYRDLAQADNIDLGDTIHLLHPFLGIRKDIRVAEIRFQPSTGRYKSITLGSPRGNILRTMRRW